MVWSLFGSDFANCICAMMNIYFGYSGVTGSSSSNSSSLTFMSSFLDLWNSKRHFLHSFLYQPMVNWWFGLVAWIPGIPYERESYLWVPRFESRTTNPNHQLTISWLHAVSDLCVIGSVIVIVRGSVRPRWNSWGTRAAMAVGHAGREKVLKSSMVVKKNGVKVALGGG